MFWFLDNRNYLSAKISNVETEAANYMNTACSRVPRIYWCPISSYSMLSIRVVMIVLFTVSLSSIRYFDTVFLQRKLNTPVTYFNNKYWVCILYCCRDFYHCINGTNGYGWIAFFSRSFSLPEGASDTQSPAWCGNQSFTDLSVPRFSIRIRLLSTASGRQHVTAVSFGLANNDFSQPTRKTERTFW